MSIKRVELDAGRVDLRDVASGRRVKPAHPGKVLRMEFLDPMGLSVYALANAIKVARSRVNDIVRGRRSITADTALRLARFLGTSPELWVNLQASFDLEAAKDMSRKRIEKEVEPYAA